MEMLTLAKTMGTNLKTFYKGITRLICFTSMKYEN